MEMRIGVLGGGLAGLTAAYLLLKQGHHVEVLEKEEEVGGLMKTEVIDGFTFDAGGSHIIFSRNQNALSFLLKFSGKTIKHRRNTKIYMKNRYIKYPFENGLSDLDPEDRFFALYEYIKAIIDREKGIAKEPKNFKEWIYYWFGKGIAELYLVPYNEKIWKYPLDKIGLDWVGGRVPSPPIEDVIKSAIGIPTEGYKHQLFFHYPEKGGIQTIALNLKREILEAGGNVRTNFEVESVTLQDDKVVVADETEERSYDFVINTLPLPTIIKMLETVPSDIRKIGEKLVWNSLIVVGIGVRRKKLSDFHWVYFPYDGIFHRIAFISNYSTYMAPEGHSSIIAEITVSGTQEPNMSRIEEKVVSDLCNLGIIREGDVVLTKSWFWPFAYVINHLDYSRDVSSILSYLASNKIISVGRWGFWRYLNMDGVVKNVEEILLNHGLLKSRFIS